MLRQHLYQYPDQMVYDANGAGMYDFSVVQAGVYVQVLSPNKSGHEKGNVVMVEAIGVCRDPCAQGGTSML